MKTLKVFISILFLSFASSAYAQFVNSRPSSSSERQTYSRILSMVDTENYGRLTLSPTFSLPYMNDEYGDTFWGLGIGYIFGINLTGHQIPLFLEIGPEITWQTRTDKIYDDYYDNINYHLLNLSTPLNITYKFSLAENISIAPFVGLTARLNLMATMDDVVVHNMFDKGYFEETPSRFQLGWNTGIGLYFNRFYVGYCYNPDITSFIKENKESLTYDYHYVNLGICF